LGGTVVSTVKCSGAFMIDVLSLAIAFVMVCAIKTSTRPARIPAGEVKSLRRRVAIWASDMQEGLVVMGRARFLLGVLAVLALMNLAIAPLPVIIPYFVKEVHHLPAWCIGLLDSALGAGVFFGAFALRAIQRHVRRDRVALSGLGLVGVGLALFGLPGIASPCIGMLTVGFGSTLFNISLNSNLMLAIPDHFRTRLFGWIVLKCQSVRPLGLSLAGVIIEQAPMPVFSCAIGATMLALTSLLALARKFCFFRIYQR
jgi:MFS transporter, DHA3 family, macrolide efflux protein